MARTNVVTVGQAKGNFFLGLLYTIFIVNWRITAGLLFAPLLANPSGISYYHFTIANGFLTWDKLLSLDVPAILVLILGIGMVFFSARLTVKAWKVLNGFFDKLFAFVWVAATIVLIVALFKEQLLTMTNLWNWSYVAFMGLAVFNIYAVATKRADFKDFKYRGMENVHDDMNEPHADDDDDHGHH